jgi:hypothetical protein
MNWPTSRSPMDLERHKPPGQHLSGPICKVGGKPVISKEEKKKQFCVKQFPILEIKL